MAKIIFSSFKAMIVVALVVCGAILTEATSQPRMRRNKRFNMALVQMVPAQLPDLETDDQDLMI